MITVQESLQQQPDVLYLHALDVLKHCLKADTEATWYKDKQASDKEYLPELRRAMEEENVLAAEDFNQLQEQCFQPKKRRRSRFGEDGDFTVDRFINKQDKLFEESHKEYDKQAGEVFVIDMCIPYSERSYSAMEERHKEIYKRTFECMSLGIPVKVIAAIAIKIPEKHSYLRMYLTVKDWSDPLFPGIWAAFKTNATTNSFLNVIMDYLIGTSCSANGYPKYWNIAKDLLDDKVHVINGQRICFDKNNI